MIPLPDALLATALPLPHRRQGKVRDVYDCRTLDGRDAILMVATDRLSAFDVVMPNGVPGKGAVLTALSVFWFDLIARHFGDRLPHHLLSTDPDDVAGLTVEQRATLRGRVMIGRRARVVPIECVVRGYLAGSGWNEYRQRGTVCGVKLPEGLRQCERLPRPIFTPATKAASGHDENIPFERAAALVGGDTMQRLRDWSLAIYSLAHDAAIERGIIIADTKFEFGMPVDDGSAPDALMLIDEALTPDSSRFWRADSYQVGRDQASIDKQYVRNYLQSLVDEGRWNKEPPGPMLPDAIVRGTLEKYLEAHRALTGRDLDLNSPQ